MRLGRYIIALLLLCAPPMAAQESGVGQEVLWADYADPTTRYQHGVLGDAEEWGALVIRVNTCVGCAGLRIEKRKITLPDTRVFEDVTPRVIVLGANQQRAVMVVESDVSRGARLSLYDGAGLIDATPYIGQAFRWLAPIGAADLDGDGQVEIAYIDRPHLTKRLRLWRFSDGKLHHLADLDGLTNHRIGWPDIPGGVRSCGGLHEMITANADWSQVMATTYTDKGLTTRAVAPYTGKESLTRAMVCGD
nr:VCBS repeat-containing protein [Pseudohalocynthiibacter aestuariivivens]